MKKTTTRTRDKTRTRRELMEAGFQEIYLKGFQAASIDNILKDTGLTRGAFFHHFPSKQALGYVLVEETIHSMIAAQWVAPLADPTSKKNALDIIYDSFMAGVEHLKSARPLLGCPLNNLSQEMGPIDPGFRERTTAVFELWISTFAAALQKEITAGRVRKDINPRQAAFTMVTQIEGILSIARNSQDPEMLTMGGITFKNLLDSMR